jgi:hypothetical protein
MTFIQIKHVELPTTFIQIKYHSVIQRGAFDPEAIAAMTEAFDAPAKS